MDPVTLFCFSFSNSLLTLASTFVDQFVYFIFPLAALLYWRVFTLNKRVPTIFVAMFLVLLCAAVIKTHYKELRPCVSEVTSRIPCPASDYSFISGHSAFAFVFVAAALGTPAFPLMLGLGSFTLFSRMQLGVHAFPDVVAGVALAFICYAVAEKIVDEWVKR